MPKILKNKWFIAILAAVMVVAGIVALNVQKQNGVETVSPVVGDLVRTVSITGKVVPANDVTLAFETSGTVSAVYKDVGEEVYAGESIVVLDSSGLNADLRKAQADLVASEAELQKLNGATDTNIQVIDEKRALVQSIIDARTVADDAVYNKVDQFIDKPTVTPKVISAASDKNLEDKVNESRKALESIFYQWKLMMKNLSVDTYTDQNLESTKKYLSEILAFLDNVAKLVSKFEVDDNLTQVTIDKYKTDVASARTGVNSAMADLISKGEAFNSALSDVPIKVANVSAAKATVASLNAKIDKTVIKSPINGVVSKQDAEVGEAISANTAIVSVISKGYEIEAYVPEVSIAGLSVGNTAKITLDAYTTSVLFLARVSHIDPAETIRDGVSTYKVKLVFDEYDSRVRSGMTANIAIETFRKLDTLILPLRAVVTLDGKSTVFLKNGEVKEKEIVIGEIDSLGNVEVLSGLSPEDNILLNPPVK